MFYLKIIKLVKFPSLRLLQITESVVTEQTFNKYVDWLAQQKCFT
jgi:hypothetical protein